LTAPLELLARRSACTLLLLPPLPAEPSFFRTGRIWLTLLPALCLRLLSLLLPPPPLPN
jgi:hypothetical protein